MGIADRMMCELDLEGSKQAYKGNERRGMFQRQDTSMKQLA